MNFVSRAYWTKIQKNNFDIHLVPTIAWIYGDQE